MSFEPLSRNADGDVDYDPNNDCWVDLQKVGVLWAPSPASRCSYDPHNDCWVDLQKVGVLWWGPSCPLLEVEDALQTMSVGGWICRS